MKTLKITKGKWFADGDLVRSDVGETIGSIFYTKRHSELINDDGWERDKEFWTDYRKRTEPERESEYEITLANAELIAEAGTVANETGYTPRQLADQNKILLKALDYIARRTNFRGAGLMMCKRMNAVAKDAIEKYRNKQ